MAKVYIIVLVIILGLSVSVMNSYCIEETLIEQSKTTTEERNNAKETLNIYAHCNGYNSKLYNCEYIYKHVNDLYIYKCVNVRGNTVFLPKNCVIEIRK